MVKKANSAKKRVEQVVNPTKEQLEKTMSSTNKKVGATKEKVTKTAKSTTKKLGDVVKATINKSKTKKS